MHAINLKMLKRSFLLMQMNRIIRFDSNFLRGSICGVMRVQRSVARRAAQQAAILNIQSWEKLQSRG